MSDLISRKELLKEMNDCKFDTVNDVARRTEHIVKSHMFELVENQPTAFDLESVIDTFETYKSQQAENEMLSDNGKWLAQRIIEECEKILKSAANATNGKNGG